MADDGYLTRLFNAVSPRLPEPLGVAFWTRTCGYRGLNDVITWVVVKIMVRYWVTNIIRHLLFRVPKRGTIILRTTHLEGIESPFLYEVVLSF